MLPPTTRVLNASKMKNGDKDLIIDGDIRKTIEKLISGSDVRWLVIGLLQTERNQWRQKQQEMLAQMDRDHQKMVQVTGLLQKMLLGVRVTAEAMNLSVTGTPEHPDKEVNINDVCEALSNEVAKLLKELKCLRKRPGMRSRDQLNIQPTTIVSTLQQPNRFKNSYTQTEQSRAEAEENLERKRSEIRLKSETERLTAQLKSAKTAANKYKTLLARNFSGIPTDSYMGDVQAANIPQANIPHIDLGISPRTHTISDTFPYIYDKNKIGTSNNIASSSSNITPHPKGSEIKGLACPSYMYDATSRLINPHIYPNIVGVTTNKRTSDVTTSYKHDDNSNTNTKQASYPCINMKPPPSIKNSRYNNISNIDNITKHGGDYNTDSVEKMKTSYSNILGNLNNIIKQGENMNNTNSIKTSYNNVSNINTIMKQGDSTSNTNIIKNTYSNISNINNIIKRGDSNTNTTSKTTLSGVNKYAYNMTNTNNIKSSHDNDNSKTTANDVNKYSYNIPNNGNTFITSSNNVKTVHNHNSSITNMHNNNNNNTTTNSLVNSYNTIINSSDNGNTVVKSRNIRKYQKIGAIRSHKTQYPPISKVETLQLYNDSENDDIKNLTKDKIMQHIHGIYGKEYQKLGFHTKKMAEQFALLTLKFKQPVSNDTYFGKILRCLRCRKLYRTSENSENACMFHSKGKEAIEIPNRSKVVYKWMCCKQGLESVGCTYGRHT